MDKMREEFESWAESYYDELWVHLCERTKSALLDCYADAWQASRQALVVELPRMPYYDFDVCEIEKALDDIGVKYVWVKNEAGKD